MLSPEQFLKDMESNRIDYGAIKWSPGYKAIIPGGGADYNLLIPVRGRQRFLKPCLAHIRESAASASVSVRVVVIENAAEPAYPDLCREAGVAYVCVPPDDKRSEGLFEKSLCYNMGFMEAPRTEWCIFHDVDILVERGFFEKVREHLAKGAKWLQPYRERRVRMLSSYATALIEAGQYENDPGWMNEYSTPSKPGSPGGSIVVRSDDFEAVGGYDPELFYGYSPEDSFFWTKLEILHGKGQGIISNHFLGSATYADNPPIEVYHLYHEPASGQNKKYSWMVELLQSFYFYDDPVRRDIIRRKKDIYIKGLE